MDVQRLAPAKVNLFLHVGPVGADGYHPLRSLISFADVGDVVRLTGAAAMEFAIEGPFGAELEAGDNNLVVRARNLALADHGATPPPFRLTLDKRLPIAAGLGGGSADAAATLRLIGEAILWRATGGEGGLMRLAGQLGADVPMCLAGRPALAEGRGDDLRPAPVFPDLDAVLVNPLRPSPTGAVYQAYDDAGAPGGDDTPAMPPMASAAEVADFLATCRNDLEAPAIGLQPAIADVLAALRGQPETLIARMSGSGATCFALCADAAAARRLASAIAARQSAWWVQPCRLAGSR
jgi:4-diphosphocytidyl-2-C-methyl-D-erythritol kinase